MKLSFRTAPSEKSKKELIFFLFLLPFSDINKIESNSISK